MKIIISLLFLCGALLPRGLSAQAPEREKGVAEPMTFKGILAEVRAANPGLQLARQRLALLEADVIAAAARPNPSLEAEHGGTGESRASEIKIVQPVPLSRRVGAAREAARGELEAARNELAALENATLGAAKRAYYAYRVASERVRFEEANLKFSMDLLNKVEMRAQTGEAGNADLARAKVEMARSRFHLQDAGAGLGAALGELNGYLGRGPASPAFIAEEERFGLVPVPGKQQPLEKYTTKALENRADLKALFLRKKAADSALSLEKARRAPDLAVGLARGKDGGTAYSKLSLGLELPLWYNNKGGIEKARAGRAALDAEEKQLAQEIQREVYSAWLALDLAGKRLLSAQETVLLLNDLRKTASMDYLSGKIGLTGFYETNRVYLEENLSYLDALLEYYEKDALLETALNLSARHEEEK